MKKIFLTLTVSLSFLMFNSCSKSNFKPANNSVATQDLSKTLYSSSEFASFVTATNNIVSSINEQTLNAADTKKASPASNKDYITKSEMSVFLKSLHVNENVYFKNREVMLSAIQNFQSKNHLTNEQSASLWNNVINLHSESFGNSSRSIPNATEEIINCGIDAGTTFAATTAVCLVLREIPFIGEELFRACEETAITTLIDSLLGCIQL